MNLNYEDWLIPNVGQEIYWELKEACKLIAGFTPYCDDNFNLNVELKATNYRMELKKQEIFFDFKNDIHKKIKIINRQDEYKSSSMQNAVQLNYEFVNAKDFIKWAVSKEYSPPKELVDLIQARLKEIPVSRTRMREQENAVIETIHKLGFDPRKMPRQENGKKGVKNLVNTALNNSPLFDAKTSFKATWERMMSCKDISYIP